ncbi:MAG: thiol oxidoreductase [Gammaproteobacteria bacterium]|nr:MAG: thiol oxidoreductase [Gammaproteobacteria bacterium]
MKTITALWVFVAVFVSANDASRWINSKDHRLDRPVAGLSDNEQDLFIIGRSFFRIPWVLAPSATTARDGLGPLFNANTCTSCHRGNGLGETYNGKGHISRALITKLSRPNGRAVPYYGRQIAVNGTADVAFEAMPTRTSKTVEVTYPDGKKVLLSKPIYGLKNLNYGKLAEDVIIVQRRAPALVGLGLLSKVSDSEILKYADADDQNKDGISGKPNWLDKDKKQLGRFTAKAGAASVFHQSAIAAANDMGLTNPLFPDELCSGGQSACQDAPRGRPDPNGDTLDLTAPRLAAIAFYLQNTRVPLQQLDTVGKKGKALFTQIGCSNCHLPKLTTSDKIRFAPYTDLLLHDMGEGLADGRVEGMAGSREFRTAPLWGLSTYGKTLKSKTPYYLHDSRAKTLEEAILWHGGEAEKAKQLFMQLPANERQALLAFLNQL